MLVYPASDYSEPRLAATTCRSTVLERSSQGPEIAGKKPALALRVETPVHAAYKSSGEKSSQNVVVDGLKASSSDFVTPLLTQVQCIEPEEVMAC